MDEEAFIAAIRDAPHDPGPRLVLADWLEDRGDPRAEWLRCTAVLWEAVEGISHATAPGSLNGLRKLRFAPVVLRLFACLCVRFCPLADGRQHLALLPDMACIQTLVTAELFAFDLCSNHQLREASAAATTAGNAIAVADNWECPDDWRNPQLAAIAAVVGASSPSALAAARDAGRHVSDAASIVAWQVSGAAEFFDSDEAGEGWRTADDWQSRLAGIVAEKACRTKRYT